MGRVDRVRKLLEFGGAVQLLLSLVSAAGINLALVLGFARVIGHQNTWDYLMLVAIFAAATPLTFPVSAVLLNLGLSQVEKTRQKSIFDNPIEIARKTVDSLIVDAKRFHEQVPASFGTANERGYHAERWSHYLQGADADLSRVAGQYAAHCFVVDDRPEPWRGPTRDEKTADHTRATWAAAIRRLEVIRDDLPIARTQWLRLSLSLDIAAGRTLLSFLNGAPDDDAHGLLEVNRWANTVYGSMHQDGVPAAHMFAPDTVTPLLDVRARIQYVQARVEELERLWKEL
jgi:hypothetical protein